MTRTLYAKLLGGTGRADESVAQTRDTVRRDPLSIWTRFRLGYELYRARLYVAATTEARAGLELDDSYAPLQWALGFGLVGLGRVDEAVEAFRRSTVIAPGDPTAQALLGWASALAGQRQEALNFLEDLEERRNHEYVSGFFVAMISIGLHEYDEAISSLHRAAEDRDSSMPTLNVWPAFDPLRPDPRFQALLRRMHFPETASS